MLPFVPEGFRAEICVMEESALPAARASGVVWLDEAARVTLLRPGLSGGDSCAEVPAPAAPPAAVGGVFLR